MASNKTVFFLIGILLIVLGLSMLAPYSMQVLYKENSHSFISSSFVTIFIGILCILANLEKDFKKDLIDEKRLVLIYGYEPPLQKGFSTTRSISFEKPRHNNPNTYEFLVSKIRFVGESRVFTWHPEIGFIRID